MFGICFADILIFVYVYVYGCKYHHEVRYKAPISGMVFIFSCCHDVFLLSRFFIVNTAMSYVIKLHRQYVFFLVVLLRSWCGLTPRMAFLGGVSVTTLVKSSCNKS